MEQVADNRRKYKRFFHRSFTSITIQLVPRPPLYGDVATGFLVDLSVGGMGLVLGEALPKKVFLKMVMTFPDKSVIESVVTVCYVKRRGRTPGFMHGIEFLNLSPESLDKLTALENNPDLEPVKLVIAAARKADEKPEVIAEAKTETTAQEKLEQDPAWNKFKESFLNQIKESV